jgi:hypothetical protein
MKNCIYCNSNNIRKFGKYKGKQKYYCVNCKKHFSEDSNPKRGLIIEGKKYCGTCDSFKLLSEFLYVNNKPRSKCKICFLQKNNSRYSNYKLTEEEFNNLLNNQDNYCVICNKEFKSNRNTFIDHDHVSGKVRGLLCPKCNNLLGSCGDNIEILKSAIIYLEKNKLTAVTDVYCR